MKSKRLNHTIFTSIITASLFLPPFFILFFTGLWAKTLFIVAVTFDIFFIIFSLLCLKWNKLFPILPFLHTILLIVIMALGAPKTKLSVFLLAPTLLAMYYGNKKLTMSVFIFTIAFYPFVPFWYNYQLNLPIQGIIPEIIINTSMFCIEMFGVLLISRRFIIHSEQVETENMFYENAAFSNANQTIDTLRTASIYHSKYLTAHSNHVAYITKLLLEEMEKLPEYKNEITPEYKKYVIDGALLHDLGKLWISDSILDKPEPLSFEEFELIKQHPPKGYELLRKLPTGSMTIYETEIIGNIILQHHEKLNGTGYPNGIHEGKITLEAQIVAIADCLDAAISFRSYKAAKDFDTVFDEFTSINKNELNQTIVALLLHRRKEIIELSHEWNSSLKNKENTQSH